MPGCQTIVFLLFNVTIFSSLLAQDSIINQSNPIHRTVKVSMIGDDESLQSNMNVECSEILLNLEDLNMSQAYTVWLTMLSDLENYADTLSFDIKGLRLWMNVYWNEDGSIRHIIYYPKPNSKNIDFDQFSNFMNGFANEYILSVKHTTCFSHFGSASFPTFYEQLLKKG